MIRPTTKYWLSGWLKYQPETAAVGYIAKLSVSSMLVFFVNVIWSLFKGKPAGDNPWGDGATTLEWTLTSPPPYHQFETLPRID